MGDIMTHQEFGNGNRRQFVAGSAGLIAGAFAAPRVAQADEDAAKESPEIGAFIKFIQQMPYEAMAEQLAEMGFTGVEATVRRGGLIESDKVEDELPRFVDALNRFGLKIHVMASDVNRADDPLSQRVLKTASKLGIKRYRMSYFRYDLTKPIRPQLTEFAPILKDLVQLNAELSLQAVYQNHAGKQFVGGTIWDIEQLVREHSLDQVGIAFDIRHATAEAGVSWPTLFHVAEPHIGAIYVKDFRWGKTKPENVPLGEGRVDPKFFDLVERAKFRGPFSLHVEYLGDKGLGPNLKALRDDLATLKKWLA
jgi:sugar phosphate isomerase/epimerase